MDSWARGIRQRGKGKVKAAQSQRCIAESWISSTNGGTKNEWIRSKKNTKRATVWKTNGSEFE